VGKGAKRRTHVFLSCRKLVLIAERDEGGVNRILDLHDQNGLCCQAGFTMNPPSKLAQIPQLYHFTDRRNLPLIRELGGLYPLVELTKRGIKVPAPGGNDWSQDADAIKGMDRYVHLCFRNNHPMEYLARLAGRIENSIFLEVHPSVLQFVGVMFTSDVANKAGIESIPIAEAADKIDYQVLYTRTDWTDNAVMERLKAAEKCEVLVPKFIPLNLIRNVGDG
jgi:hypothetical protein